MFYILDTLLAQELLSALLNLICIQSTILVNVKRMFEKWPLEIPIDEIWNVYWCRLVVFCSWCCICILYFVLERSLVRVSSSVWASRVTRATLTQSYSWVSYFYSHCYILLRILHSNSDQLKSCILYFARSKEKCTKQLVGGQWGYFCKVALKRKFFGMLCICICTYLYVYLYLFLYL